MVNTLVGRAYRFPDIGNAITSHDCLNSNFQDNYVFFKSFLPFPESIVMGSLNVVL